MLGQQGALTLVTTPHNQAERPVTSTYPDTLEVKSVYFFGFSDAVHVGSRT